MPLTVNIQSSPFTSCPLEAVAKITPRTTSPVATTIPTLRPKRSQITLTHKNQGCLECELRKISRTPTESWPKIVPGEGQEG